MSKENLKEIITYIIIIALVVIIRTYFVTLVRVSGTSMESTLKNGDILVLNKYIYNKDDIKRFDIVVVKEKDEKLIKRVIGLPSETLEYKDNTLYINGKVVKEDYLKEETDDYKYEGKIPENCYFVMGDNRDVSLDSRYFGCFDKKQIKGKVIYQLLPLKKFGEIN